MTFLLLGKTLSRGEIYFCVATMENSSDTTRRNIPPPLEMLCSAWPPAVPNPSTRLDLPSPSRRSACPRELRSMPGPGPRMPTTVAVLKRVEAKSRAVAAHVLGATVGIINQSLAGNGRMGEGSGVVVSEDGLILTVGHVIAKPGSDLTVIFPDGRRAAAKALGEFRPRFRPRQNHRVRQVASRGNGPFRRHQAGHVVHGLGPSRRHPAGPHAAHPPGRVLNSGKGAQFLVTDATVISGDSGGPLFDLDGRVIGVHSNIGMSVNQNQHVPIDVYREQWNDLLAGKAIGTPPTCTPATCPTPKSSSDSANCSFKGRWPAIRKFAI